MFQRVMFATTLVASVLASGCGRVCPGADLARVDDLEAPAFLVVSHGTSSAELALVRSDATPLTFTLASGTLTEVWAGTTSTLPGVSVARALDIDARFAWNATSDASAQQVVAILPDPRRTLLVLSTAGTAIEIPTLLEVSGEEDVGGLITADALLRTRADAGLEVWVTRSAGMAAGAAMGDDVALLSQSGSLIDAISLREAAGPMGMAAAPSRMAWVDGALVVGLERGGPLMGFPGAPPELSPEMYDEGAFAVIDPERRSLAAIVSVDPFVRCKDVVRVAPQRVAVACAGRPGEEDVTAGVVLFELTEGNPAAPPRELARFVSGARTDAIPSRGLLALSPSEDLVAAISAGDAESGRDDVLFAVNVRTGSYLRIASGNVVEDDPRSGLGGVAFDPASATLLVGLRRSTLLRATLSLEAGAGGALEPRITAQAELPIAADCRFTPRHVRWLPPRVTP